MHGYICVYFVCWSYVYDYWVLPNLKCSMRSSVPQFVELRPAYRTWGAGELFHIFGTLFYKLWNCSTKRRTFPQIVELFHFVSVFLDTARNCSFYIWKIKFRNFRSDPDVISSSKPSPDITVSIRLNWFRLNCDLLTLFSVESAAGCYCKPVESVRIAG